MSGSILWGLTWIWLKQIHTSGLDAISTGIIAYAAQFLLVLPFTLRALGRRRRFVRTGDAAVDQRAILWLMLLGLLGGISGIAFTAAMIYGQVVRAMMLFFLIPAWGVLFGRLFLGEAVGGIRFLAVVLALTGSFLILGPQAILGTPFNQADIYALVAGLTLAASNVLFLYLQREPLLLKLSVMQFGTVLFGLLALWLLPQPLPLAALKQIPWSGVLQSILYGSTMLLVAILATQYAVERLPAGRAAILMTLELLVAVFSAVLIGHEHPPIHVWLGGALIMASALSEAIHKTRRVDPVITHA